MTSVATARSLIEAAVVPGVKSATTATALRAALLALCDGTTADLAGVVTEDAIADALGYSFGALAQQDNLTAAQTAALPHGFTDVTATTSTNIGSAATVGVRVTGSGVSIANLGTVANAFRFVLFAADVTLAHNATYLILPSAANITTAAGDMALFLSDSSGNWRCASYTRADGTPVVSYAAATIYPTGYIAGLTLANNASAPNTDIDIATGVARNAADTTNMALTVALTKSLASTWAVGSGNGGLDTGTKANSTWYYVYLIKRTDTGVVDALFSTSATSPTMPTNYTARRLVGAVRTNSSGNVIAFKSYELAGGGLEVSWTTPITDVSISNTLTTSRRLDTLTVPTAFSVIAELRVHTYDPNGFSATINCPDLVDQAPGLTAPGSDLGPGGPRDYKRIRVRTSASGQIASRSTLATVDQYDVTTLGFAMARR